MVREWYTSERALLVNFVWLAVCFSVNHACVTSLLALATRNLGQALGGVQTGVLYSTYTLSALFMASGLVQRHGFKNVLGLGLGLYCLYVASFLVADKVPTFKWQAAIIGSFFGGLGAGWLWTAQGTFFARTSVLYGDASNMDTKSSTSVLAAWFSTIYVGSEVVFKFLSSTIEHRFGVNAVFVSYTLASLLSSFGIVFVRRLPNEEVNEDHGSYSIFRKVMVAIDLWVEDDKMKLLTPLNLAFGFSATLMNLYVNGIIAEIAVGGDNIGYLSSVTPCTAALLGFPYSFLSNRIGKGPLMMFGAINFVTLAVILGSLPASTLQGWGWGIVVMYIIGGSGRAVFESTNKATFADFFPNNAEGAFANVIVQSGVSSAFASFIFPHLSQVTMSIITGITGIIALYCLGLAFRLHKRESTYIPIRQ